MSLVYFAQIVKRYNSQGPTAQQILKETETLFFNNRALPRLATVYKSGCMLNGKCPTFIPKNSPLSINQKAILGSLLNAEGNWTSINTWDAEGFTLGLGISIRGPYYMNVINDWLANAKEAQIKLNQLGIDLKNPHFYEEIKRNRPKLLKLQAIFEDKKLAPALVNAEIAALLDDKKSALHIPEKFPHWDILSQIAAAHLLHWSNRLGCINNPKDYSTCENVADVIRQGYSNAGKIQFSAVELADRKKPKTCAVFIPYKKGIGRILSWARGQEMVDNLLKTCELRVVPVTKEKSSEFNNKLLFQAAEKSNKYYVTDRRAVS